MRKIRVSLILIVALVASVIGCFAEVDFSDMSLDELLEVQEQLNSAIKAAQGDEENANAEEPSTPAPDASNYTELTKGSKGDEVKALQTRLFELGFYSSAIDGDYGNGTVNAIKAFEEFNGLEQTGIATAEFQALLFSENAKAKPVPVASIKAQSKEATALVGGTLDMAEVFIVNPENATEKGVVYTLDSDDYATIDESGVLTAKERGDMTVTATSRENVDNPKSASVKVKVRQPSQTMTLNESDINLG